MIDQNDETADGYCAAPASVREYLLNKAGALKPIIWKNNPAHSDLYEARIDDKMVTWIVRRPSYCDRGHWQTTIDLPHMSIDGADAFPRYFMRFETAVQEIEMFLRWRLWKIPAPDAEPKTGFAA